MSKPVIETETTTTEKTTLSVGDFVLQGSSLYLIAQTGCGEVNAIRLSKGEGNRRGNPVKVGSAYSLTPDEARAILGIDATVILDPTEVPAAIAKALQVTGADAPAPYFAPNAALPPEKKEYTVQFFHDVYKMTSPNDPRFMVGNKVVSLKQDRSIFISDVRASLATFDPAYYREVFPQKAVKIFEGETIHVYKPLDSENLYVLAGPHSTALVGRDGRVQVVGETVNRDYAITHCLLGTLTV